jgi:outer membrane protein OmpA-like peptidoglycan-associated protein
MRMSFAFAVGVALALLPAAATAQQVDPATASPEELMILFKKQKSRGLTLAPNTGLSAQPAEPVTGDTLAAVPEDTTGAATATTTVTAATGAEPVTPATGTTAVQPVAYTQYEKAEQVNLRIAFDFDSALLRDSEKPKLANLCTAMKGLDDITFRIVGHTDGTGTDAYNETLSLLRAEEVKRWLVSDCGLPETRLEAVGVGRRFLYNSEDPAAEENRRVEFQALS